MYELNKNEILRDNRDFNAVYTKGRSYVNKNLVLHVLNDERYNGKVGFAAGKKLGCAVVRNRVKRLLRETYRLCKKNLRREFNDSKRRFYFANRIKYFLWRRRRVFQKPPRR